MASFNDDYQSRKQVNQGLKSFAADANAQGLRPSPTPQSSYTQKEAPYTNGAPSSQSSAIDKYNSRYTQHPAAPTSAPQGTLQTRGTPAPISSVFGPKPQFQGLGVSPQLDPNAPQGKTYQPQVQRTPGTSTSGTMRGAVDPATGFPVNSMKSGSGFTYGGEEGANTGSFKRFAKTDDLNKAFGGYGKDNFAEAKGGFTMEADSPAVTKYKASGMNTAAFGKVEPVSVDPMAKKMGTGSVPPTQPPVGGSILGEGGWKGLGQRLMPSASALKTGLAGVAAAGVVHGVQSGLEGLSAYSTEKDPGASPVGHALGNSAQFILDGQKTMAADRANHKGLLGAGAEAVAGAFTRKDQLKPDQVLAAPEGSPDEKKLQDSLGAAKLKAEQERMQLAAAAPHDAQGADEGGAPAYPAKTGPSLVVSTDSTNPSSSSFGKSDHSGDEAVKLKYLEQQALLGNKPASYGHEGTVNGHVKEGWTQDPDKMVDGWAKSEAANPQGLAPKNEDQGTKEMQHYKEVMSWEPEGSDVYKAAEKSLGKATAVYDHFNAPKQGEEGYQSTGQNQSVGGAGLVSKDQGVPDRVVRGADSAGHKSYSGNPEYAKWKSGGQPNGGLVDNNPVSIMHKDENGTNVWSVNPDHRDVNTGRTRQEQHQYDNSPEGKANKEYSYLLDRGHHENFMGREDIGRTYAEQAAKLYDTFSKESTQRGVNESSERSQKVVSETSRANNTDITQTSRYNQDGVNRATMRGQDILAGTADKDRTARLTGEREGYASAEKVAGITADGQTRQDILKAELDQAKLVAADRKDNRDQIGKLSSAWGDNYVENNKSSDAGTHVNEVAAGLSNSSLPLGSMDQGTYNTHANAYSRLLNVAKNSSSWGSPGYKLPTYFPEMAPLNSDGIAEMVSAMQNDKSLALPTEASAAARLKLGNEIWHRTGGSED